MTKFRYEAHTQMLWVGNRGYPVSIYRRDNGLEDIAEASDFRTQHPDYRMYTRQVLVPCENRWTLSVIWGDATYSSNHMGYSGGERQPFIEEPTTVEIGILEPSEDGALWGDPLSYVDAEQFHRLASCVSRLPLRDWPPPVSDEFENPEDVVVVCDYIETTLMEQRL